MVFYSLLVSEIEFWGLMLSDIYSQLLILLFPFFTCFNAFITASNLPAIWTFLHLSKTPSLRRHCVVLCSVSFIQHYKTICPSSISFQYHHPSAPPRHTNTYSFTYLHTLYTHALMALHHATHLSGSITPPSLPSASPSTQASVCGRGDAPPFPSSLP